MAPPSQNTTKITPLSPCSRVIEGDGSTSAVSLETDGLLRQPSVHDDLEVFYVNITVIDASMAVYNKVRSKLSSNERLPGPKQFREKLASAIATKAAEHLTAKAIAEKLSKKLPQVLMYKLAEKGLKLFAETVFLEKNYFVIQLQVQSANPVLLLESLSEDRNDGDDESVESVVLNDWIKKQEKELNEQAASPYVVTSRLDAKIQGNQLTRTNCPARWMEWLLAKISKRYRDKIESRYLPVLIQKQITKKMDDMLRAKMAEKNMIANTEVLPQRHQARYFFNHLREVRKF